MESPVFSSPYIMVKFVDGSEQRIELNDEAVWTMGRDRDNKIVLNDSSVSRHHALLQCLDSTSIYLIDLGSSNGSFVNQRRITIPTLLRDRDQVVVGQTEMLFFSGGPRNIPDDRPAPTTTGEETAILHVRRLISVLVVDIRGFTQLTQSLEERLLSRVIGEWFQEAGEITRHNGSRVDKYIGDAVMAVWFDSKKTESWQGEKTLTEENLHHIETIHIFHALKELFLMTERISHKYKLPDPIRIGAGISTGYAIVGQMGGGERQEYTVLGDTVNVAFRLESATRSLNTDIVISEDTFFTLRPEHRICFTQVNVLLKGYDTPHTVFHASFPTFQQALLSP
ncbi:MAG: adenylate/guanylate cyclase domain-containing protein [Synechococcales cyanobacterium]